MYGGPKNSHLRGTTTFFGDVIPDTHNANDIGTTSLRIATLYAVGINLSGSYSSDVPVGTDILSWDASGGLRRITTQGGLGVYADSSILIHAGDHFLDLLGATELNIIAGTTIENIYLIPDGAVFIRTNRQGAFASTPLWSFGTDGNFTVPGDILVTTDSAQDLGATAARWAVGYFDDLDVSNDILLASGSIISFDSGDVLFTHSAGQLTLTGKLWLGEEAAITPGSIDDLVLKVAEDTIGGLQIQANGTGTGYIRLTQLDTLARLDIIASGASQSIALLASSGTTVRMSADDLIIAGTGENLGFYDKTPVAKQTGVAVTAAGIHAALVNLGLITA